MKCKRPLAITVVCILIIVATLGFVVHDLPRIHFVQRWVTPYLCFLHFSHLVVRPECG